MEGGKGWALGESSLEVSAQSVWTRRDHTARRKQARAHAHTLGAAVQHLG